MKMRIGFDAKRAFNNGTGLGNYARFVIKALLKFFPDNEYFLFTPSIKSEFQNFIPSLPNIHIITPESAWNKTFHSVWRSFAITDLIKEFHLDVFHGLSNELPNGIEKLAVKKVVTIHDLIFLRYPNYYNNIDRYIYTKKFKHACQYADVVLATSLQTKQDIINHFHISEEKIIVAYQNCDECFEAKVDEKIKDEVATLYQLPTQFILCVGTIEERKNQFTVLKAFHELNDENIKLVFIGKETMYAKYLHDYINDNLLNDRVFFLKDIKQNHLPVIYQLSSLFVYASEFEGFGIPVLEGLRSRVPILAANTSSLPEVGGDAALYFKFDDAHELANQMHMVLNDNEKRNAMIEKEIVQAKKFDTENLMKQLWKIYFATI